VWWRTDTFRNRYTIQRYGTYTSNREELTTQGVKALSLTEMAAPSKSHGQINIINTVCITVAEVQRSIF
jgi:hypothetical protein